MICLSGNVIRDERGTVELKMGTNNYVEYTISFEYIDCLYICTKPKTQGI